MTVNEFQEKIIEFSNRWDKKRNTNPSERSTFIHLVEEVGELAREYVSEEKRKEKYNPAEVENAIGDIIFQVVKLAHLRGLNIEEIVTKIIRDEEIRLK